MILLMILMSCETIDIKYYHYTVMLIFMCMYRFKQDLKQHEDKQMKKFIRIWYSLLCFAFQFYFVVEQVQSLS